LAGGLDSFGFGFIIVGQMKKPLIYFLNIALLSLATVTMMLGGHLVVDVSVLRAFFLGLVQSVFKKVSAFFLAPFLAVPALQKAFDRFLFLQINDPLLI
jgi:hypothetical protein